VRGRQFVHDGPPLCRHRRYPLGDDVDVQEHQLVRGHLVAGGGLRHPVEHVHALGVGAEQLR
jgi:hypothetical protein